MQKGGTSERSRPASIDCHRHEDRKAIKNMNKRSQKKKRSRQRAPKRSRITVMGISVEVPEQLGPANAIPAVATKSIREAKAQAQEADNKSEFISELVDLDATSQAFAAIATNAWRAKARMVDPETGEPREEVKRIYRDVEAILAALDRAAVDIQNPVGNNYDSGMAVRVLTFESTPGLQREKIKETIKPQVKWEGRRLQVAEVVVGTPPAIDKHDEKGTDHGKNNN